MKSVASFIDGGYLAKLTAEERISVDFGRLAQALAGETEILRTTYYDCLPFLGADATPKERERFSAKHRFFTALSHLPRFQVRLGKLAFRGCDEDGKPIYAQKRVDVGLGAGMAVLAAKRMVTDISLVAADSDFIPAIEIAKAEGVSVHLFYGECAHKELVELCDDRTFLSREFLTSVARNRRPLVCIG
jgi:uncharacterized LabA/DUF88 family protein